MFKSKKITITEEEFLEVVKKANDEFMKIASESKGEPMLDVLMGMQNLAFGALISNVMFDR